MRKPRDYDSELRTLSDKAKQLKDRKLHQLGELVIATGADVLPVEQLAGALLSAMDTKDAAIKEGWRKRGAAFFHGARKARGSSHDDACRDPANGGGAPSVASQHRA